MANYAEVFFFSMPFTLNFDLETGEVANAGAYLGGSIGGSVGGSVSGSVLVAEAIIFGNESFYDEG